MIRLLALVFAMLFASQALAQSPPCGPRLKLVATLAEKYKEFPVAVGLSKSGALVEIFASENGATWTLVVNNPNGITCLIDSGEGWQGLIAPPGGYGS